jgi:hypothetical protein
MKIETSLPLTRNAPLKSKTNNGIRSGTFLEEPGFERAPSSYIDLPNLNALFTLQENISDHEAFQKADELLDDLENLRNHILWGKPSQKDLEQIEILAKNLHTSTKDKRLTEILREIEIRAAVELAKLSR